MTDECVRAILAQFGVRSFSPKRKQGASLTLRVRIDRACVVRRIAPSYLVLAALAALVSPGAAADELPEPYFDAIGVASAVEILKGEDEGAGGSDFRFQLAIAGEAEPWTIISRGSTPFLEYRLGPTYLKLDRQTLAAGQVRVVGVKKVDRIPPSFHDQPLPAGRTVTALIVASVADDAKESPLYVNNWFHPWRNEVGDSEQGREIDGLLDSAITRFYIDRADPYWVCGWLPADTAEPDSARRLREVRELLEPDAWKAIAAVPFKKGCYRGYLVSDKTSSLGYRLKLTQFWRHMAATGGYELIVGNVEGLEKLR